MGAPKVALAIVALAQISFFQLKPTDQLDWAELDLTQLDFLAWWRTEKIRV